MRKRHHLLRALLFTVAGIAAYPAMSLDCGLRIAAEGSRGRTVVLAGGDAWPLLSEYLDQAKKHKVDPWKIKVVISVRGKQESFQLGWASMLTGANAETLWERDLKGKRADLNRPLVEQAQRSHWDVMCVGSFAPKPDPDPDPKPHPKRDPKPDPNPMQPDAAALIYYKSGVQYAATRDYANALKEFRQAEKLDSEFPGLLMNIGVTYMQMKDYVRASDYLTRAVAQNPKDASTHLNMACLQSRLGQRDDAIASLTAAKSNGLKMTATLRRDPDLAALRGRKDFEALFGPVTTEK
jgi:tetratricopeptide (TPR) repeat protein